MGAKELLAMGLGYRESTESWAGVLRDLRERGLAAPLLAVGDGALGLWAALREVYPTTRHQHCSEPPGAQCHRPAPEAALAGGPP
jgi:transposase-like protein